MRTLSFLTLVAVLLGCGSEAEPLVEVVTHRFEPVSISAFEESSNLCQSWTLGNTEPIYVQAIRQENDGAWHHSNWFFVDDATYDGPDGTWPCRDRGFSELEAGLAGGVFFAQSTQARQEEQRFPDGFAIRLPPNARVLGDIHLLNLSDTAFETTIEFEMEVIPEEEVISVLQPMSVTNLALAIPPRSLSEFSTDCMFTGGPASFDVHYVLAHYHALGTGLQIELIGGEHDGELLFESTSAVGEPLGTTLDPPFNMGSADGFRLTCAYDNPREDTVGYGIGDQEMCVFLAYITGSDKHAGSTPREPSTPTGEVDGVQTFNAPCGLVSVPQ